MPLAWEVDGRNMPVYTYSCVNCGLQEISQSIHDSTLISCPICYTMDFKKIYGKVGIQFKGSGFYSTDSKGVKSGES